MKSNIMKRAWEIARTAAAKFGHSVKSYLSMALKMAWAEIKAAAETAAEVVAEVIKPVSERIDELVELGFNRWQKGNFDRLYINASTLGLTCRYYNSGNIADAYFDGERVSNCEARRMKAAKTYLDVKTGRLYSDNSTLKRAAAKLARIELDD